MKLSETSKFMLRVRRFDRDMRKKGFLPITENGGELWRLNRGDLWGYVIAATAIGPDGKSVWFKPHRP